MPGGSEQIISPTWWDSPREDERSESHAGRTERVGVGAKPAGPRQRGRIPRGLAPPRLSGEGLVSPGTRLSGKGSGELREFPHLLYMETGLVGSWPTLRRPWTWALPSTSDQQGCGHPHKDSLSLNSLFLILNSVRQLHNWKPQFGRGRGHPSCHVVTAEQLGAGGGCTWGAESREHDCHPPKFGDKQVLRGCS